MSEDAVTSAFNFVKEWSRATFQALERRENVDKLLRKIPEDLKEAVLSSTTLYSGLAFTALGRATLLGNSAAVRALKAAGSKPPAPVSLAGVDPDSWRAELPEEIPAFITAVLRLCTELSWLHLAVLSGDPATVRLVHGSAGGSDSPSSIITPALLSLFAQQTTVKLNGPLVLPPHSSGSVHNILVGKSCTPEFARDAWALGVALTSEEHLIQLGWQLACLSAKRPGARPFQLHTHLSLMPAMLPSISLRGVEIGKRKVIIDKVTLALACIARVHPELAPSGWQTELAFKEEDGLAPMFRAVLDSNPHSTHAIRLFVDEYVEDGLPTGALPHPRISSGRWQGYSPVLLAAAHGKLKNIQALLPVFHGSLEEQTPDGSSVLHLLMGRQDCSLFLTPSVLDSFKDDEQYEIFKAVRGLWQSELGVLVEHWAEQPFAVQDFLMGKDHNGSSCLHLAARQTIDPRLGGLLELLQLQPHCRYGPDSRADAPLSLCLRATDRDGMSVLMRYYASNTPFAGPCAPYPPPVGLVEPAEGDHYFAATAAVIANLAPIPSSLLLSLLGQRDPLGRTCLWLLFRQARPSPAQDKVLALAKMAQLGGLEKEYPDRFRELCSLHQQPLQLPPEQQAANRELLEELQLPLIHAWQLSAKDFDEDFRWLAQVESWGLDLTARDADGRTLLHKACLEQHRSLVASLLQCAHDVLLPLPDNDGLLPMGMAVACNEVLTAAIFFMHPKLQKMSKLERMALIDDGSRENSLHHMPLHTVVMTDGVEMLCYLQQVGLPLADARPEYLQVKKGHMLKSGARTPEAWFESSLLQCAASMGRKLAVVFILGAFVRERRCTQQDKQALESAMTAAVDLPGLLGASNCPDATGEVAPGRPEDPAWQQAAALRAQLGLKQQPELGGKHLMCVFTLLQTSAGLQLAQLLRVQAACAALDKRKIAHPLSRLLGKRTLHSCGGCSLYGLWRVCSACRRQHYCSPACQEDHWPTHQSDCRAAGA